MNFLSYRIKLFKYSRESEQIRKSYLKDLDVAKKKGDREEIQSLLSALQYEQSEPEDKIKLLKTHYLISIADKLSLPTPPITEKDERWEKGDFLDRYVLTNKGITELRGLIRQENKEKHEIILRWIPIIIGLIGAITGLVAVLKK
jgi:hypothetical protein